jgi:uncharacterized protein (DUF427 family)
MVRASWHNEIIAESEQTIVVEGNHYFHPGSVNWRLLEPSDNHTFCAWKGSASYYDVIVDGERNPDAAWTYPDPSAAARQIAGHVAFWHGVRVEQVRAAAAT